MTTIALELNGRELRRDVPARMHLADFVREEGRQTGTHEGERPRQERQAATVHGVRGSCRVRGTR